MTEGFIVDSTHSGRSVSTWVEGAPLRNFFFGISIRGKAKYDIRTWRCGRCGFLENYAN